MPNTAPTFHTSNGTVFPSLDAAQVSPSAVSVQADGKIVVVGIADGKLLVQRFLASGQADPAFSSSGTEALNGLGFNLAADVQLQADGKLVIVGGTHVDSLDAKRDLAVARLNADGSLDTTFSGDGWLSVDLGGREMGMQLALQSDGKIVTAGYTKNLVTGEYDQLLQRFLSDGRPDTGFNTDGTVRLGVTKIEWGVAPLVQADGKVVLVGAGDNGTGNGRVLYLSRVLSGGQLDTSFGGTGTIKVDVGQVLFVEDAQLQKDGKIVVMGSLEAGATGWGSSLVVMRFNANGTPDTSFGVQGSQTYVQGEGRNDGMAMALQKDGKIVITGAVTGTYGETDLAVLRLNSDGSLDGGFGAQGLVKHNLGSVDSGMAVALQADGKIVVAGQSGSDSSGASSLVLERLLADGGLDTALAGRYTLGSVKTAVEDGAAVVLEPHARIFDAELAASSYAGASLVLQRHGGVQSGDLFLGPKGAFLRQGETLFIEGTGVAQVVKPGAGQLELLFLGGARQDNINTLLQSLSYMNANEQGSGTVQIDWLFSDGNTGAQGAGGALSAAGATTVNLVGINDAPYATGSSVKVYERGMVTLALADFGFHDAEDGDVLTAVRFDGPPRQGIIKVHGQAITGPVTVTAAEIQDGHVIYMPFNPKLRVSYDDVSYRVMDSGGQLSTGASKVYFSVQSLLVNGTTGDDVMTGSANPEDINGGDGNDTIFGLGGDDVLMGGKGANILDGGDGLDVALYSVFYPNTLGIRTEGGKTYVNDFTAGGASDVLTGIERIQASGTMYAIDTDGAGGQAYRLYQAAFDRKPDLGGLGFWITQLDRGVTLLQVAQAFTASPEFKTLFGANPDHASLVTSLYQHVLHRAPEQAGFDFWLRMLDEHPGSVANVLLAFSESPENQAALIGVISHGMEYTPYYG